MGNLRRHQSVQKMLYKEDWPQARERWEAFWQGEVLDRVCISVTAPRRDAPPVAQRKDAPANGEALHTDIERTIEGNHARFGSTFWGGEALPVWTSALALVAHGHSEARFDPDTVWGRPWLSRSSPDAYRFDPGNRWWRRMLEMQTILLEESRGKYFVGDSGPNSPTDALSSLRGPEGLCLDILDRPDEVRAMLAYLTEVRDWMNERLYPPLLEAYGGIPYECVEWGPGRAWPPLQCDFSIMIGPGQFREFVMPELTYFADRAERCKYHLDGPGALRHLPAILEIDKIGYVQWVPGAGAPAGLYWIDVWNTVRAAGKSIQVKVPYGEVEEAVRTFGPKGLFIRTTAPTEEAARELLRRAERWSCRHPWDVT